MLGRRGVFGRRGTGALLAVSGLALALAGRARADGFRSTRSPELVERAHTVRIVLERDRALLEVERTLWNGGARPDQATIDILTAPALVPVGLRTASGGRWFEGELLPAETAAARYRELTGIGGYYPKDPALLSYRDQGHFALQVFPCMPGEEKRVAYTLVAPTRYRDGRYVVELEPMGTNEVTARAVVRSDLGPVTVDGAIPDGPFDLDQGAVLELAAPFAAPVEGRLATQPFATGRVLSSFHLDVAPRLGSVPRGARVVVLLDGSRSVQAPEWEASVGAASAYLAHFGDGASRAAVLTFHRGVAPLTPGFVPIDAARDALGRASLPGKNGSELGTALAAARSLFASAEAASERRLLVLTDLRTRAALEPDEVRRALPAGAVVHVATTGVGTPSLARDDASPWAAVPRATGGLLWHARSSAEADDEPARRATFEEWARPMRIDRVRVTAPGLLDEALENESLREGAGLERSAITARWVPYVSLTGELWSRPVTRTLAPDADYGRDWSALVFGTDLASELTEPEMMTLARAGRAVSPVTSYLAIEPGVRPSTEGLEETWGTGQGVSSGHGYLAGSHRTRPIYLRTSVDFEALLRDLLAPEARACGLVAGTSEVRVESTLDEIVALDARLDRAGPGSAGARCLVERAWAVELPPAFDLERRVTTVRI